jgi:hypothetical protein
LKVLDSSFFQLRLQLSGAEVRIVFQSRFGQRGFAV